MVDMQHIMHLSKLKLYNTMNSNVNYELYRQPINIGSSVIIYTTLMHDVNKRGNHECGIGDFSVLSAHYSVNKKKKTS